MTDTSFERVWAAAEARLAAGRIPGYVAAVRIGGRVEVRAGGQMALGEHSPPMREDTLFRIASITKPMGAALALSLVQDGALGKKTGRGLYDYSSKPPRANPEVAELIVTGGRRAA